MGKIDEILEITQYWGLANKKYRDLYQNISSNITFPDIIQKDIIKEKWKNFPYTDYREAKTKLKGKTFDFVDEQNSENIKYIELKSSVKDNPVNFGKEQLKK